MKNKLVSFCLILITIQIFSGALRAQDDQQAELIIQTGHFDTVTSIVHSPDGKIIATGSNDKQIILWDAANGKQIKTFKSFYGIESLAFSPDGRMLAADFNRSIMILDLETGIPVKILEGHTGTIISVKYAPDGKSIISGSYDNTIKIWDTATGNILKTFTGHTVQPEEIRTINALSISPDGKIIASGGSDQTVKLWNVSTGAELMTLKGHKYIIDNLVFSPDGKRLVSSSIDETKMWDTLNGSEIENPDGKRDGSDGAVFMPDGKIFVTYFFQKLLFRNSDNGKLIKHFSVGEAGFESIGLSPDGMTLLLGTGSGKITLFNTVSTEILGELKNNSSMASTMTYSPDSKLIAVGDNTGSIRIWSQAVNQKLLKTVKANNNRIDRLTFSNDSTQFASAAAIVKLLDSGDFVVSSEINLWDIISGQKLRTIPIVEGETDVIKFSPNGQIIASANGKVINLWETATGKRLRTLAGHTDKIRSLSFSPDGSLIASGSNDLTVRIWETNTGNETKLLAGHSKEVIMVNFAPDGKTVVSDGYDQTIKLWNVASGAEMDSIVQDDKVDTWNQTVEKIPYITENYISTPYSFDKRFILSNNGNIEITDFRKNVKLCNLIAINENDWVVITPDGLFDASPEARKLMHYIVGFETISLDQMKDLYYVPGLLQKIYKDEPLPKVELFSKGDLFPEVEFDAPKAGQKELKIKVKNRGGGIGQVQVLVNGKEVVADARPAGFDSKISEAVLTVSLQNAAFVAGGENKIEVIAKNISGSLSNRGTRSGTRSVNAAADNSNKPVPDIYVIAGGISDYTGDGLDLSFAAKDAENFAKTIELGATALVTDKSKVHIRLLTSNGANANVKFEAPDAKITTATKADFQQAFADFSNASPNDVFIVYLAGHGVSLNLNQNTNQAGGDTYLYLTQEATTTDRSVLSIKQSREAMSISGEEIKDLMKLNKAVQRLVLILDTCAAGALSNSLVAKRDLPSDQIKALETLKDNTGFYVLMGSSADAVSYEASQFGQGLLTYSLLQGMKGAKLRGGDFAFVGDLFGYAQEQVPEMAKNIGGIQRPILITPDTSNDFPIGKFTTTEQRQIILSGKKPLILRPSLQNKEQDYDDLELTRDLQRKLREENYIKQRGVETSLVYIEADEMSDAIKPSGSYIVTGDDITLTIRLIRNKTPFETITLSGKLSERDNLIKNIVSRIIELSKP